MNVAQAPQAHAIHAGAILGNPRKIQQAIFAGERLIADGACRFAAAVADTRHSAGWFGAACSSS